MKNIDAIFCDIDGTLVDDDKVLHQEEIDTIKKIIKQGTPFILVSGRPPVGMFKYRDKIDKNIPMITFGGGLILDENGNKLFEQTLDRETALEVFDYANEIGTSAAFNFYTDSEWYTDKLDHPMEQWEANSIGATPIEADIREVTKEGDKISKCLFVGDPEEIDRLEELMNKKFPDLNIIKSLPVLLEVVPYDVNKAKAIEFLSQQRGINLSNSIALGDNFNDLEMLEVVGQPIIMENAPRDLKKLDRAIIAESNNNHGVSKILKKYLGL